MRDRPLFVFGSMLDDEVLERVLDRPFDPAHRQPARLDGFSRLRLPDESYPVLVPDEARAVHGELLLSLSPQDHARIAFYESEEYGLSACEVRLSHNDALVAASFYSEGVAMPGAEHPWELGWWQREHKDRYLVMIERYMALYGAADLGEAERLWAALSAELA